MRNLGSCSSVNLSSPWHILLHKGATVHQVFSKYASWFCTQLKYIFQLPSRVSAAVIGGPLWYLRSSDLGTYVINTNVLPCKGSLFIIPLIWDCWWHCFPAFIHVASTSQLLFLESFLSSDAGIASIFSHYLITDALIFRSWAPNEATDCLSSGANLCILCIANNQSICIRLERMRTEGCIIV